MIARSGKSNMAMTYQNIGADFQPVWTCRCGVENFMDVQICRWCGKRRPPQISLGGKIR